MCLPTQIHQAGGSMTDPRVKFAIQQNRNITSCVRCDTSANVKRYKRRVGESWQVIDWCHVCNRVANPQAASIPLRASLNFQDLPEFNSIPTEASHICVVCGSVENIELHHWAPFKKFGEEFLLWPVSYLCHSCHMQWHKNMNSPIESQYQTISPERK